MRSRKDYLRLSDSAQRILSRSVVLLYLSTELNYPRFGITVSRRVGNAVARNRIKRYFREFLRLNCKGLPPRDYVLIARSAAANITSSALFDELKSLILKLQK